MPGHQPVLLQETLEALAPNTSKCFIDATFGRGGHTRALLDAGARVVALDQDPEAIKVAEQFMGQWGANQLRIVSMNFRDLQGIADQGERFDGILFDLGVSSPQLDQGERGFSFMHDGPLDMRMNPESPLTAHEVVNTWDESELACIFFEYCEERRSRRVASAVVKARKKEPLETTTELAELISAAVGGRRNHKIHPATKCFQALRICVNDELGSLDQALSVVPSLLKVGGRMAVISFHALEDRRVKRFIEKHSQEEIREGSYAFGRPNPDYCFKKLGRWKPSDAEIEVNIRSRSARLRAAEKVKEVGDGE
ncbi:MAG: 16S rRNA (cytosine(1402)-N(4))-methyltransferase RsmH [Verrucomicrobiota bacterium]